MTYLVPHSIGIENVVLSKCLDPEGLDAETLRLCHAEDLAELALSAAARHIRTRAAHWLERA